jgi:hypothetical protein
MSLTAVCDIPPATLPCKISRERGLVSQALTPDAKFSAAVGDVDPYQLS